MYIKCDTIEQLDEVRKYYNAEEGMSSYELFQWYDNEKPICWGSEGEMERNGYAIITYVQWKESPMKLDLRKLAEDNIVFILETDDDIIELLELTDLKQNESLLKFSYVTINKDYTVTFYNNYYADKSQYPTWTEIKEKYIKQFAEDIVKYVYDTIELPQAITLLQSHGYKVEKPYIEPTDEEICDRLKFENDNIGYVADWNSENFKYIIQYDHRHNKYSMACWSKVSTIGILYTTQSIAQQIVEELNEKRFVRV